MPNTPLEPIFGRTRFVSGLEAANGIFCLIFFQPCFLPFRQHSISRWLALGMFHLAWGLGGFSWPRHSCCQQHSSNWSCWPAPHRPLQKELFFLWLQWSFKSSFIMSLITAGTPTGGSGDSITRGCCWPAGRLFLNQRATERDQECHRRGSYGVPTHVPLIHSWGEPTPNKYIKKKNSPPATLLGAPR